MCIFRVLPAITIMDLEKLKIEYDDLKPVANRLSISLKDELERLLEVEGIRLGFPIQVRVKTWESLVDKITSGRFNIKETVIELQDLIGIRIITLFKTDANRICELIKKTIQTIKFYNTLDRLESNQFGYSSYHIVGKIPEDWTKVPSFKGTDTLKFEIQVRTISEHTWAEVSNALQYKQESDIPKQLLRAIGRVSALLELVDSEFERLIEERYRYKESIKTDLDIKEEELNVDTLNKTFDLLLPKANKDKKDYTNYSDLLFELRQAGITTVAQLTDFISNNISIGIQEDKNRVAEEIAKGKFDERLENGVFFTHAGLVRITLAKVFPDKEFNFQRKRRRK